MTEKHKVIVFDLDDTLYKEIDFLKSAYQHIARLVSNGKVSEHEIFELLWNTYKQGGNAFEAIVKNYGFQLYTVPWMLNVYRHHKPHISLDQETMTVLNWLKTEGIILGIISDGRYMQQMNKIEALGLKKYICEDNIVINTDTEHMKPDTRSFKYFMQKYGKTYEYWYVGDNTAKDFIAPNSLNWRTVCLLDDGRNIHKQSFLPKTLSKPDIRVKKLSELFDSTNIEYK